MTKKEKLATEYNELCRKFYGTDFKENVLANRMEFLTKEFKVSELEDKIKAVKNAIESQEIRKKKEAYFETPEGKAYKENLEAKINANISERHKIREDMQDWVISEVNNMIPGNWTAIVSLGYKCGNVEIGLVNRDPKRNFPTEFGHDFTIYYDSDKWGDKNESTTFELNYGTIGSFDLFNDETRPVYLNGLATISNNKEWLKNLMNKFAETVKKTDELLKITEDLRRQLDNPKI